MAHRVSNQTGTWNTGSTWVGGVVPSAGDTVELLHDVTVPAGTTTIGGVLVGAAGTLRFPVASSAKLILNASIVGNLENRGWVVMKPNSVSVVHELQWINIVESNFVGGGNDPLTTDPGFWNTAGGRVDLVGASKKCWTRSTASVAVGATSMTVEDATGWQIGDEIFICPTGKPITSGVDYNDGLLESIDPFMDQFERRVLTSVSGNVVGWTTPLVYAHNVVTSSITGFYGTSSKTWRPEVGNLTRNVKVGGETKKKRTHIFFRNTIDGSVQNMQYVQFNFLGPRKVDTAVHSYRPVLVSGRYGVHFHHCHKHSMNSLIYGCSMSEIGNRGYVLHGSDNITMSNNISFDYQETAMWWDEGHITHFAIWEDNLMAGMRWNGLSTAGFFSMGLLKGDNNAARRNVVVYGSNSNPHGNGAYQWSANSEGVWIFEDNMAHSCVTGLWVWQNTSQNHTIVRYDSYNCDEGISHGAYGNSYQYTLGHHYRSHIHIVAASANTNGVVFKDIYIDNGSTEPYGIIIEEKNGAGAADRTNKFIQCTIKNYTAFGLQFWGGGTGGFALPKMVDLINCDIGGNDGTEYELLENFGFNPTSWVRLQKIGSGVNRQHVVNSSGTPILTSGIADFAPNFYGDGILGLKADMYNGANFTDYKVSQHHAILYFDSWHPQHEINTDGAHHLISSSYVDGSGQLQSLDYTYSIRWTGQIQPHYTANHTFTVNASGQYRMYLDDGGGEDLIINMWGTTSADPGPTTSAPIALTQGVKYNVRLEFNNLSSGAQGFQFWWKTPQMSDNQLVPQSQLYEPTTNTDPISNAGADQSIILPTDSINLSGIGSSDIDGTITTWAWTRVSGPNTPTITTPAARDTLVTGLIAGTYVFRLTVTDDDSATDTDDVTVIVSPPNSLPVVNAGTDQTFSAPQNPIFLTGSASDPDGTIASVVWTKDMGPAGAVFATPNSVNTQVTGIVAGTYIFRLTATDNVGGVAFDQVQVNVSQSPANVPPTANAGPDKVITLPTSSTVLQGSGLDSDGSVQSQTWTQVSGPNTANIQSPASMTTVVSGLVAGTYVFRLTVKDNQLATGSDDVTVTVNTAGRRNQLIVRPKKV